MTHSHLLWTFLAFAPLSLMAQSEFVHISTADYVVSDSLPLFTQELAVEQGNLQHEVTLVYPEYAPLSSRKWVSKMEREVGKVSQPKLDISAVVEQKHKRLVVTFVPFVYKDGKWLRITSCKLKVVSAPATEYQRSSVPSLLTKVEEHNTLPPATRAVSYPHSARATRAVAEEQQRWASSSVLSQGRWVKIRVEREGIYNLSAAFLRKAGFSQPERVKVFGYGGLQQDERLLFDTESESVESQRVPDDLVEVPTLREGNQLLFWAEGTQRRTYSPTTGKWVHSNNYYSRYSYYFLTEGDAPLRISALAAVESDAATTLDRVPFAAIWDEDQAGLYQGGRRMFDGHDFATHNQKRFNVNVADLAEGGGEVPVEVSFAAASSTSNTTAEVQLNGDRLGQLSAAPFNTLTSSATLDTKTFRHTIQDHHNWQ